jgi:hypothetical protein
MESGAALAACSCNGWPNGSRSFPRATGRSCDFSARPALRIADLHCHGGRGPARTAADGTLLLSASRESVPIAAAKTGGVAALLHQVATCTATAASPDLQSAGGWCESTLDVPRMEECPGTVPLAVAARADLALSAQQYEASGRGRRRCPRAILIPERWPAGRPGTLSREPPAGGVSFFGVRPTRFRRRSNQSGAGPNCRDVALPDVTGGCALPT